MTFFKLINAINYKQIVSLFKFFLRHPVLMIATIKATIKTMKIVQDKFPGLHGLDNKENAFRHALWNYLIALRCFKKESQISKIISWTKEITDWHEDFSPNTSLARAMDLHNNYVGRALFLNSYDPVNLDVLKELDLKMKKAIQITSIKELKDNITNLVFIK